jgi:hypothetical protein
MEHVYNDRPQSGETSLLQADCSPSDDHCYDSYYKVYNENEEEYFADDNPLSSHKSVEFENFFFSGNLGVKIKKALSGDEVEDDSVDLASLSGERYLTMQIVLTNLP